MIRRFESGYASIRKIFATATSAPESPPPPPPPPASRVAPPRAPCERLAAPDSSSDCNRSFTFSGSVYFRSYDLKIAPFFVGGISHDIEIISPILASVFGSDRTVMEFVAARTVTTSVGPSAPPAAGAAG